MKMRLMKLLMKLVGWLELSLSLIVNLVVRLISRVVLLVKLWLDLSLCWLRLRLAVIYLISLSTEEVQLKWLVLLSVKMRLNWLTGKMR